ncbi:polyphosphate kinase 2, partial [Streptomyces sp. SID7499]|nr:polyphosphate kinase 2 [Streptomyces sp. SID7499]
MTRSAKRNGRSGTGGKAPGGTGGRTSGGSEGEAPGGTGNEASGGAGGRAGRDEPVSSGASERAARLGGPYLGGFGVVDSGDDDPVLVTPEGHARDAWREDYPYDRKLRRRDYDKAKRALQIELLKLQHWVKERDERLVILFEGRDAAGKGGTIKRFTEHLNPRGARVVALEKPTERERTQWYFQRYTAHLPSAGEIVLFDRSWYNRAG